jgi:tripartite-type tricarboxylate transporter receptor subunit TctC
MLKQPHIVEAMAKQGLAIAGGPPERLGQLVEREIAVWGKVVKEAGITAD